jgi:hypothetical protein
VLKIIAAGWAALNRRKLLKDYQWEKLVLENRIILSSEIDASLIIQRIQRVAIKSARDCY